MNLFNDEEKIHQYFQRINYSGELKPIASTLASLQKSHLYTVPFENLDIHYGNQILLDPNQFYHKIVSQRRGGFCYELNGLFHHLLKTIGFEVNYMSAMVYKDDGSYAPEFGHLFNWVTIHDDAYICDVGFGEFSLLPIRFELDVEQKDPRGIFIVQQHDPDYFRISKKVKNEFVPEYIFQKRIHALSSFEDMCNYHQTNAQSTFTQKRLISLATEHGRITITNDVIKVREKDKLTETHLNSEEEFQRKLWELFYVKLSTN